MDWALQIIGYGGSADHIDLFGWNENDVLIIIYLFGSIIFMNMCHHGVKWYTGFLKYESWGEQIELK